MPRLESAITTTPAGGAAQTVGLAVIYHPFGAQKLHLWQRPDLHRTIDLDGRIAGYTVRDTEHSVGFDAASRITSIAQSADPGNTYGYDALDRLTSAVMPGASQSFGYDPVVTAPIRPSEQSARSILLAQIPTFQHFSDATAQLQPRRNGSSSTTGAAASTYDVRGRLVRAATVLGGVSYASIHWPALRQDGARVSTLFHYDARAT